MKHLSIIAFALLMFVIARSCGDVRPEWRVPPPPASAAGTAVR